MLSDYQKLLIERMEKEVITTTPARKEFLEEYIKSIKHLALTREEQRGRDLKKSTRHQVSMRRPYGSQDGRWNHFRRCLREN